MKTIVKALALAASVALVAAGPAFAQKQGGTLTVGLELDIPGFDPLKVGVYDTSAEHRRGADVRHADQARRQRQGAAQARGVLVATPRTTRPGRSSCGPDVKFQDGTPFNAQAVKWNFDRQKDPEEQLPLRLLHRLHQSAWRRRTT